LHKKNGNFGEETLELLAAYGIPVTPSKTATNEKEAVEQARAMEFPVAMKVISPDAIHKSEAGGVLLDLKNEEEVAEGFAIIRTNLREYNPSARFDGVRIQPLAAEGYDMFVGGKEDPSFGPVIFFGLGGIYVEVFKDIASVICPAKKEIIAEKLQNLRSVKILTGLRGKETGDIDAFIDLTFKISQLLADFPSIKELDINPVRVFPTGRGAIALDARMRLA